MDRIYRLAYRLPAGLFGLAYSFGMLFFLSTVSWYKAAGPLLFLYIAFVPAERAPARRFLATLLVVAYIPVYLKRVDSLFPFTEFAFVDLLMLAVEAFVTLLFMLDVWGRVFKAKAPMGEE